MRKKWTAFGLKAGEWSLLLAIAFLAWRRNNFVNYGIYSPAWKPSEPLIALSLFALFFAYCLDPAVRSRLRALAFSSWTRPIIIFFGFIGIASASAALRFPDTHLADFWGSAGRIFVGAASFGLVYFFGIHSAGFLKRASLMFLSALFLAVLLFLPHELLLRWFLVVSPSSYSLLGTHTSPLFFGSYLAIPLALVSAYFFGTPAEDKMKKIAWGIAAASLFALVIWASSRSGWLAGLMSLLLPAILLSKGDVKKILRNAALALAVGAVSVSLLAPRARDAALSRIFPNPEGNPKPVTLEDIASPSMWKERVSRRDVGFYASRGEVWSGHFGNFIRNPLGVGVNYSSIFNNRNSTGQRVNAHSFWLELLVAGGIGGFAAMGYFVARSLKKGWDKVIRETTPLNAGIFSAWAATLVNFTFVDALEVRWFWIMAALLIVMIESNNRSEDAVSYENPI